jgi:hypothetical protein
MAVEVDKEKISVGADGRIRLSVQWLTDTRAEALRGIPKVYEGLVWAGHSASPFLSRSDGRYLVPANYEGLLEDQAPELEQYEIDSEFREVKLETFPNREILRKEWGASEENGRLIFAPKIKRPNDGGTGLGSNKEEEIDNPLFNATTYPVEYAVATMRILRKRVPPSLERAVGSVVGSIPSGFDYQGNAKSWFVRPLRRRKAGNMWEITVQYQQVDEFTDVSVLLALLQKTRSGGRGTGLQTGTITTGSL